jgi:NAD(P)H-dependent FMN reductase
MAWSPPCTVGVVVIPDETPAKPCLLLIVGSTRPERVGLAVAEWMVGAVEGHGVFSVRLLDLAEIGLPFLDEPEPAATGRYRHTHTERWSATVRAADAFLFVTPEYNHSFPGALKNAIDFLYSEWHDKPAAFVGYGTAAAGGARSVQALRSVAVAVKMFPIGASVLIPSVRQRIDGDGRFVADDSLVAAAARMLDEVTRVRRLLCPMESEV